MWENNTETKIEDGSRKKYTERKTKIYKGRRNGKVNMYVNLLLSGYQWRNLAFFSDHIFGLWSFLYDLAAAGIMPWSRLQLI